MKQVRKLILMLMLLTASVAMAATRQLTGEVVDTKGEPMVGASVMLVNSKVGAIADINGRFSFSVPDGALTLKVASVGYQSETVKVAANQNSVRIVMKESAQTLEETVVVGYGTQKKVNLTGAVASIEGKSLEDRPAATISNMLQGSVAGLNVTTSSGVPGSSPDLNIRGMASINGGSPLVLIDGSIGSIDNVNPNDVASISVIKDASAAAVYGARAAFGVILVTTKNGQDKQGKSTVRYNGRFGWETPTTSTDYENTGYWSVYLVNKFWQATNGTNYISYTKEDMQELLARVNDKTENPERPWVVEQTINGKRQWKYYANTDWYDELYNDRYFQQQHNISMSGGANGIRYFLSGGMNFHDGLVKISNDKFKKYNMRAKFDFPVNKWITVGNNTSFYGSTLSYQGGLESAMQGSARHALACYPLQNPDGSYIFSTPYQGYNLANGRHILYSEAKSPATTRKTDFSNNTRVTYTPIKQLTISGDFTYRLYQNRQTNRRTNLPYRVYPDAAMQYYVTGAGINDMSETVSTYNYYGVNAVATYKDTFKDVHNLTVMGGYNYESRNYKSVYAMGQNLTVDNLADLNLVGPDKNGAKITDVSGGQNEYALQGFFGRVNYDYVGKYLLEISGRYDGTSRFAKGKRYGWFPSGSLGWRFSEEEFMQSLQAMSNGKLRVSYGSLGNQNVSDYYTFLRLMGTGSLSQFSFGEGATAASYATLGSPIASNLTWEKTNQYDLGLDLGFFNNRLSFTGDVYIRDTKDMLAPGVALPAVYGATSPKMNVADLRTKGYELALTWNDSFTLAGKKFTYSLGGNLSDYKSVITRYDNPNKTFAKDYYVGMELGELWLFKIDGLFKSDAEAQEYARNVDLSYVAKRIGSGWAAGDVKYIDLDGDNRISLGDNTVDNPGDRYKYGNSLPTLQYGLKASGSYVGIDVSVFFQGTGNHYWYPNGHMMNFWGCYSYPYVSFIPVDFKDKIWREDNPDAYFPRPMAYGSTSGTVQFANDRYVQNLRYLRFKNLTVGYTIPQKWTRKALIDKVRFYFTGENLCYWSPMKKNTLYVDPEAAVTRSSDDANEMFYPWSKSYMFGLDITF